MTLTWRVATDDGVSLDTDELVGVLETHQRRVVETWRSFGDHDWDAPTRNAAWSVHETARHVADATQRVAARMTGDVVADAGRFDPRSTPDVWLASSHDETPDRTVARYEEGASRLRDVVAARLGAGDQSHEPTVYGEAHWTVNVVHVLWDSWLHERDVLLPLGRPVRSSPGEQRLVGLYGVLMSLVPAKGMGIPLSVRLDLTGPVTTSVEASCDNDRITSAEVASTGAVLTGELEIVVDALSGRGTPIAECLPGAPEELGYLGAFMNS